MGYNETYGNAERSIAEAIADELVSRNLLSSSSSVEEATSANQSTEIERLIEIRDRLTSVAGQTDTLEALLASLNGYVDGLETLITSSNTTNSAISGFVDALEGYTDGIETNQATQITRLTELRDRLPSSVGVKTASLSLPVTLSSDGVFSTSFGITTASTATSDTGSFSFLQFIKRLLSIKLPSTLSSDRFKVENLAVSTQRTTAFINTSTTGTIAAGASSVAIANTGAAAGTVKGVSIPAGASISWSANGNDVLDAVNYVATGSTFLITTVV